MFAVSELPKALSMDPDEFKSTYSFEKPGQDDLIVLNCRTNRRAKWAAALCNEAGLKRWGNEEHYMMFPSTAHHYLCSCLQP